MPSEKTAKIARNSLSGLARYLITLPVTFFITPYILRMLGPGQFGIWALVGVLGSFIQLSDFGVGVTLIKYVAEIYATGDIVRLNTLVSTAAVLYVIFAAITVVPLVLFRSQIATSIFRVPGELVDLAARVLGWAALIYGCRIILSLYSSVLTGLQRMDVTNFLALVYMGVNAIGVYLALKMGLGLPGLVIASGIATLGLGFFSWGATRLTLPNLSLNPTRYSKNEAKTIFSYGWPVQISNFAGLGLDPLNKIILTNIAGVGSVANYEVAARVSNQARGIFAQAILPLLPAASELQTTHGRAAITRVYEKVWRYLWIFAFPGYLFIFILAKPFIVAWLGSGYPDAAYALQVLIVAQWVSLVVTPLYLMLQGIGLVRQTMLISVETGVLSAVLSLLLGWIYGFQGVVAGLCAAFLITAAHTFLIFRSQVGVRLGKLINALETRNFILMGSAWIGLWGVLQTWGESLTLMQIGTTGLVYIFLYGLGLVIMRGLRPEDIRPVQGIMPPWLYQPLETWFSR